MSIKFFCQKALLERISNPLQSRIESVISEGNFIKGPEVGELEQSLAALAGVEHCIGVSSGTDALLASLMAIGITPGDEVITPAFSYIAAAESIKLLGAKPVYVEVNERTYNLDPSTLPEVITDKTKAIIAVDMFGQVADYNAMEALLENTGITLIEDAAQSFGAQRERIKAGSFGKIATTSFFPTKPLGCFGDGGAIFTNDNELASLIRQITVHGQSKKYHHDHLGLNARLDTIQAAILLAKLPEFEFELQLRREAAEYYDTLVTTHLSELGIVKPYVDPSCISVHAQYTLQFTGRDELRRQLTARGIPTAVHYPLPIYSQWGGETSVRLHITEQLCNKVLSLPFYPGISQEDQLTVIQGIKEILTKG